MDFDIRSRAQESSSATERCVAQAAADEAARIRLTVRGVVQGVGFRPYVYRLASRYQLAGWVLNSGRGVTIELEGAGDNLKALVRALPVDAPPMARIDEIFVESIARMGDRDFVIRTSDTVEGPFTLIPPDVNVCDDCLNDLHDSLNRRHWYPFTNCTNCGPRYSIIQDIPYDRRLTTMNSFVMCENCRREYEDPTDRRFHAQPNACPACGPHLSVYPPMSGGTDSRDTGLVLAYVARALLAGKIVALKGLGGYQLACDARQQQAVAALRERKHRSEKPFAVMVESITAARSLCSISAAEASLLLGPERPIVLLVGNTDSALAEGVSPGNSTVGLMLPSTPMHELLFLALHELAGIAVPLIMTSGNLSEDPIVLDGADAERKLANVADLFVHHNRPIYNRVDDSVARVLDEELLLIRRARGYVPHPIRLDLGEAQILACGAQQKSTLCLTKAGFALPSQHLGDLENYETLEFFEQTLERMCHLFHIEPEGIAHDLHPGYLSTQWALNHGAIRGIPIQHHHAHIAACMAEHGLHERVIGVAWDGTGLGPDRNIWGGEFLLADFTGFERVGHLRNILLPGGDVSVREPWRIARSYLLDLGDKEVPDLPVFESQTSGTVRLVDSMLRQQLNTVTTSSAGRLFDAVAALICVYPTTSYEGQAAVALEALACAWATEKAEPYDFDLDIKATPIQLDFRPMVRAVVRDLLKGEPRQRMAARFHLTLIAAITSVCLQLRDMTGVSQVCLGGGCFQNMFLLRGARDSLRSAGFEVFYPQKIPANDGGISVGQAAIACELLRGKSSNGA